MVRKSKPNKPAMKPVEKSKPKRKPVNMVACSDCVIPRRDDITDRSSGLLDSDTLCSTCNGSGQIKD